MTTLAQTAGGGTHATSSAASTTSSATRDPGSVDSSIHAVKRSTPSGLSFIVESTTRRGRYLCTDHFAIEPSGDYDDDAIAGLRALAELMAAISDGAHQQHAMFAAPEVMTTAAEKIGTNLAARVFLQTIAEFIPFVAVRCDWKAILDERIAQQLKAKESAAKRESRKAEAFVARMRAARAAKAPARKEPSHG